jgi:acyl-CoA reductase-like NAD-dependent aldehyde dehydrogenase
MDNRWADRARSLDLSVFDVIDGRRIAAGSDVLKKLSPRDGHLLYEYSKTSLDGVDDAVTAARHAYNDGRWSSLSSDGRKRALLELASQLERHKEDFALLECLDVGKPIRDALSVDIPIALSILRFNAEAVDKLSSSVLAADASSFTYQLSRSIGVVAAIVGWNFPLVLALQKIAPALAVGNSVVLKPSELTSLSACRVAELAIQAGIPPGVLNIVHGGSMVGDALARHPDVDVLSFTGSSRTGKSLLVTIGQSTMKRHILECGGKAPNIVFDDCPELERVADAIVARAFWNQGQVCTASSRLLVHEDLKDELLRLIIDRADALRPGDPLDPETAFGALVSAAHQEKVLRYIDAAKRESTVLHQVDAQVPFSSGYYVPPTIFDCVKSDQSIAREEIFGPVLAVMPFRTEAEAIHLANDTEYGLSAIAWTRDLARGQRLAMTINAGSITVNATGSPHGGPMEGVIPSGGFKESGIGVEGGLQGLKAYMNHAAIQFFF